MDASRFDAVVRSFTSASTRRRAVAGVFASLFALGSLPLEAKKKKKKFTLCHQGQTIKVSKKGKKKHLAEGDAPGPCPDCPAGTQFCGGSCCAAAECIGGACCPADRACGTVCCAEGALCGDAAAGACVTGQGTCATGADTCGSGNLNFCNASNQCFCVQSTRNTTRCASVIPGIQTTDCGHCTTDSDCELLFPAIPGVFCARNAINDCGCQPGENICGAPCPG